MRLFIAVNLSEIQKQELHQLQQRLQSYLSKVSWVSPEKMHITLKFLGEVDPKRLPEIAAAIRQTAASVAGFNFGLKGLGVFPNLSRARVIWTGMQEGRPETGDLFFRLETALAPLGFANEGRKFVPHLTLGRPAYPPSPDALSRALTREKGFAVTPKRIDKIILYRSHLSGQGTKYEPLVEEYLSENAGKNNYIQNKDTLIGKQPGV